MKMNPVAIAPNPGRVMGEGKLQLVWARRFVGECCRANKVWWLVCLGRCDSNWVSSLCTHMALKKGHLVWCCHCVTFSHKIYYMRRKQLQINSGYKIHMLQCYTVNCECSSPHPHLFLKLHLMFHQLMKFKQIPTPKFIVILYQKPMGAPMKVLGIHSQCKNTLTYQHRSKMTKKSLWRTLNATPSCLNPQIQLTPHALAYHPNKGGTNTHFIKTCSHRRP